MVYTGGAKLVAVKQFDGLENTSNFPAKNKEVQFRVKDALNLNADTCVLDAGCAHGDLLFSMVHSIKLAIGIDLANKNIEIAKKRALGIKNIDFKKADFNCIPYPDNTFDAVVCNANFMYVPLNERLQVIREFKRVVKTGGKIFLGDMILDSNDRGWGIYMWKVTINEVEILSKSTGLLFEIYRTPQKIGSTVWWDALLHKECF